MNTIKVGLLMAAMTAIFVAAGHILGGSVGVVFALALAVAMNFGTYWFSDKLVLSMTRAKPILESDAPELHAMVSRLAQRANIPKPRLYIVPDPSPNAFATGRNPANGVVAVNQGLLDMLSQDEVEGVIAHEIGHIKSRDTLTSTVVATMAGAISSIAHLAWFASILGGRGDDENNPIGSLLLIIVAPLAATLVQLGISRAREYEADKTAALLTNNPRGLQSALAKLSAGNKRTRSHMQPSMAHMCIVSPLSGVSGLATLFSTHPPVEARIAALEKLRAA